MNFAGSGTTRFILVINAQLIYQQFLNKPTLVIAHNKTLAAQLYGEFKEFFPENAVEYFVSYYYYKDLDTRYRYSWKEVIYI